MNCTLEELTLINLIKEKPNATQKEIAAHIGKSERTVKTMTVKLQNETLLNSRMIFAMDIGRLQTKILRIKQCNMLERVSDSTNIKALVQPALATKIGYREMFMKDIGYAYYYK